MFIVQSDVQESSAEVSPLLGVIWSRVVIDEAHCIKNHKSLTAVTVCRLRATNRWALTGTPIQNNLLDMYALLRSAYDFSSLLSDD